MWTLAIIAGLAAITVETEKSVAIFGPALALEIKEHPFLAPLLFSMYFPIAIEMFKREKQRIIFTTTRAATAIRSQKFLSNSFFLPVSSCFYLFWICPCPCPYTVSVKRQIPLSVSLSPFRASLIRAYLAFPAQYTAFRRMGASPEMLFRVGLFSFAHQTPSQRSNIESFAPLFGRFTTSRDRQHYLRLP
jgi:hypothetical protein